jgi:hypothetical protein
MATKTHVRGEIEAVNDFGLRIRGDWFNYSKYPGKTVADLAGHDRGDFVDLVVNDKWIDQLMIDPNRGADPYEEPVAARVRYAGRDKVVDFPAAGNDTRRSGVREFDDVTRQMVPAGTTVAKQRSSAAAGLPKEEQICRQCCLKAAAEAYQPTGEEPFEVAIAVISIAKEFEAWAMGRMAA